MLPSLLAIALPQPRPPDLLKRAPTYSSVAYDSATGRVGLDDILKRRTK